MRSPLPPDLSSIQAAIWLDQKLLPGKPIYNTGQVITIRGPLRADLLEIALRETIAESPGLQLPPRTRPPQCGLVTLDLRHDENPLNAARQWMHAEMGRAIPLEDPALFCFALIRLEDDVTLWFQKYHHIVIDATGRRNLTARTALRYRALRFGEPLPALDVGTPDELLEAERRYPHSAQYEIDRDYWHKQLADWGGPLVGIERQGSERSKSGRHARNRFRMKRSDFTRLDEAARSRGSSAFRAIIALTYIAFARLYNRSDILFGLELATRATKAKDAIGLFARPVPLLLRSAPDNSIAELLQTVETARSANYPHRFFPVQDMARDLEAAQIGHHGLFDVIVNYIPAEYDRAFENEPIEIDNLSYGFTVPWLITVADSGRGRDLDVTVDTDPGVVSPEMAACMASCLEVLLGNGLQPVDELIGSVQILSERARADALKLSAGPAMPLAGETIAMLCAAQAAGTPNAVALIFGERQITFAELHSQATTMARRLAAAGVKPGATVGIALPRTPSLIVAVLAVHKAGGAYLGLDPSYPTERIRFIISDAQLPVIVTDSSLAALFADSGAQLLIADALTDDVLINDLPADDARSAELVPASAHDLAYVLYTSGSTGSPKAVAVEHRNLVNLIYWGRSVVSDSELSGMLFSTSLNFDLSAFELMLPLAFGGCIIMVENLLAVQSATHRSKVRLVNTGPSLLNALLRAGGLPPHVSAVIVAGEKLSRRLSDSLFKVAPGIRLLNCYGPTETTVYSTCAIVEPDAPSEPSIGRPIWNTSLYVRDGSGGLLPRGVIGDLFIGGAGVGRGYLGREELTRERFLSNPHGEGRLYRTGDLVRWRADGELEFHGRTDDQIKIHGIRIEPGEIEATLAAYPGVADAVVMLHADGAGVRRLTAYVVRSDGATPTTADVRAALERQLPRNMVPAFFVWLDRLPLTPNGKVNRKALPAPVRADPKSETNRAPETRMEQEIAKIWQDILEVEPTNAEADFFESGGDSLAAVSLFATIESRFGRSLSADILSGGLTIAKLAEFLAEERLPEGRPDPVVPLQPLGALPPFFCVHGIGGDVLHLYRLAARMGTLRPFLGLRRVIEDHPTDSVGEIAARFVDAILVHQPAGPFYLGGFSFGANIAYEIAVQLMKRGHEVTFLALIDQRIPGLTLSPWRVFSALHRLLPRLPERIRSGLMQTRPGDRARYLGSTLLRWLKLTAGYRVEPARRDVLDADQSRSEQMYYAHLRALQKYRPQPLPKRTRITLIRAGTQSLLNLSLDATLGWREVAGCTVGTRVVAGNHHSILREPAVAQLAKELTDALNEAGAA